MKKFLITILICVVGICPATAQKKKQPEPAGNILLVVTTHGRLGNQDQPTGFWLSEVSRAWAPFVDAGYSVTFASPGGGAAPVEPRSLKLDDPKSKRMWEDRKTMEEIGDTTPLEKVDPAKYDAIYLAGGHGAMWDFPESDALQKVTEAIYENGGVVAAVCHGPAGLVDVKTSSGTYLIKGRNMAAFTNSEEKATGLTDVVPFLLQSKLEERGAKVKTAPDYAENVVKDGRLITGQNPASAAGVAEETLKALKK